MDIRKSAIVGIITLALTPTAFAEGLAQDVDALETENAELREILQELVALQRCHGDAGVDRRMVLDPNTGEYVQLGVDWSGCDKRGIWLRAANYWQAGQLFNAKLVGTDFTSAWIHGVAMNGANLEGANFTNADLSNSILTGAFIIPYSVAQAYGRAQTIFSNTRCPDGTNSDDPDGDEFTCMNNRTP
jgi:uncharacterized protein YjbI with pentapeptide repeats